MIKDFYEYMIKKTKENNQNVNIAISFSGNIRTIELNIRKTDIEPNLRSMRLLDIDSENCEKDLELFFEYNEYCYQLVKDGKVSEDNYEDLFYYDEWLKNFHPEVETTISKLQKSQWKKYYPEG